MASARVRGGARHGRFFLARERWHASACACVRANRAARALCAFVHACACVGWHWRRGRHARLFAERLVFVEECRCDVRHEPNLLLVEIRAVHPLDPPAEALHEAPTHRHRAVAAATTQDGVSGVTSTLRANERSGRRL
eukprot:1787324-Pleurochrysis_carterae.AAC.1